MALKIEIELTCACVCVCINACTELKKTDFLCASKKAV